VKRAPRKHFPPGAVREVKQFTVDCDEEYRWDFAWRDPASGRVVQFNVRAYAPHSMSEADFAAMVREPALACIEREVHRKCGMDYAMANRYQLALPRHVPGRYV